MSTDTKTALLDAAEQLFADQGFAATSMRELTARAGANIAAVNYHFGSKAELAMAVLRRRIEPINRERHRRLDALPEHAAPVELLRAFLEPVLLNEAAVMHDGTQTGFCRVFGRLNLEQPPFLREFLREQFRDLAQRFVQALAASVPGVPPETLWWRLHFVVGSLAHTLQNAHLIAGVSDGICTSRQPAAIVAQLVAFATGGLTAPLPTPTPTDEVAR